MRNCEVTIYAGTGITKIQSARFYRARQRAEQKLKGNADVRVADVWVHFKGRGRRPELEVFAGARGYRVRDRIFAWLAERTNVRSAEIILV